MMSLPEYSTSMENNVSQKWVGNESWHAASVSTIVQPWKNDDATQEKGVIRVKMDDNEGRHLTHRVNDRIYGERGWQMSWIIVPELDEWVMKERLLSHKKMSHRNIHQYRGEKHLGYHFHGILLFGISSHLLIFFSCFVLLTYSPNVSSSSLSSLRSASFEQWNDFLPQQPCCK